MLFSFPETSFFLKLKVKCQLSNFLKNGHNLRAYRRNDFQIQENLVIL